LFTHPEDLMRFVASLCALVALALFAVACGGSDKKDGGGVLSGNPASSSTTTSGGGSGASSGGGSTAGLNPCTLFTKEDAAAALGRPVADAKLTPASPPLGQTLCFYGAAESTSANSVQLSIVQTSGMTEQVRRGGQSAKTLHDGTKAGLTGVTAVPGTGQDAFLAGTSVYVLKGETHFSIMLNGNGRPGEASHSNALKAAATKVAAKMP
jgi:hypothetical protein